MIKDLNLIIISESSTSSFDSIINFIRVNYPTLKLNIQTFQYVKTEHRLSQILCMTDSRNCFVLHHVENETLSLTLRNFLSKNNINSYDPLQNVKININNIIDEHKIVGDIPSTLDDMYYEKINAIEFSVINDDGKHPEGLLDADVVLVGVSRTSKTPLSLYLANQGLRVANVPLVKGAKIPDELFMIDKNKIFGLTTTPDTLNKIRTKRLVSYGINPDENSRYSDISEIQKELADADKLFNKLGCTVINVANRSIEESAEIILKQRAETI